MSLAGLQGYLAYLPARTPVETFLVGLFVAVVAAKVVQLVMKHIIDEAIRRTSTDLDDILYEEFALPVMLSIVLLGGYVSFIPLGIAERWMFYIRGVILSVLAVFWAVSTSRAGDKFFSRLHSSEEFDSKFIPVFENVWKFVVLLGAIFGLLAVWKINVTPLLASAGIAGIAIGFAAKDTVANFFGGIALYFDNTYEIGDFIVLDSGESGFVEDVGVRSTTIRTRDDEIINIPNSLLNSTKITNQSAPVETKRIRVPIGVAYGTDIERLEEALLDVAEQEEFVVGEPEPRPMFREFGDSSLDYELVCWVKSPEVEPRAKSRLNRAIYRRLAEEDIEIPFPQRTIHYAKESQDRGVQHGAPGSEGGGG